MTCAATCVGETDQIVQKRSLRDSLRTLFKDNPNGA
jgi:hypothetical protein